MNGVINLRPKFIYPPIHLVSQTSFLHQVLSTGLSHKDPRTKEITSLGSRSTLFRRDNRHQTFHARGGAQCGEEGVFIAAWCQGDIRGAGSQCGRSWEATFRQKVLRGMKLWNVRRFRGMTTALVMAELGVVYANPSFLSSFLWAVEIPWILGVYRL